MPMKSFRSIIYPLTLLVMVLSSIPLLAQHSQVLEQKMQELQKAQEERLPSEVIAIVDATLPLAINLQNVDFICQLLEGKKEALKQKDWGDPLTLFYEDMHRTNQAISSFEPSAQIIWLLFQLHHYSQLYLSPQEIFTVEVHPFQPQYWSSSDYKAFVSQKIKNLFLLLTKVKEQQGQKALLQRYSTSSQSLQELLQQGTPYWYLALDKVNWSGIARNLKRKERLEWARFIQQEIDLLTSHYPQEKRLIEWLNSSIQYHIGTAPIHKAEKQLAESIFTIYKEKWAYPLVVKTVEYFASEGQPARAIALIEEYNAYHASNPSKQLQQLAITLKQPYSQADLSNSTLLVGREIHLYIQSYQIKEYTLTLLQCHYNENEKELQTFEKQYTTLLVKPSKQEPYTLSLDTISLKNLPVGDYRIRLSTNELKDSEAVQTFDLQVVDYLPVEIELASNQKMLQLLEGWSGNPITSPYKLWHKEEYKEKAPYTLLKKVSPDKLGCLPLSQEIKAIQKESGTPQPLLKINTYLYGGQPRLEFGKRVQKAEIITDRGLYRPGQKVQFVIIAYQVGYQRKEAQVLPHQELQLILLTPSGEELIRQKLSTDSIGMAQGSLTLPSIGQRGTYRLSINTLQGKLLENYYLQVEEYKRPSFEVTLLPLEGSYSVGDTVMLKGTSQTLSGQPLKGAEVRYKLLGQKFLWGARYIGYNHSERELLNEGKFAIEASDGSFAISLPLEDLSLYSTESEEESKLEKPFQYHTYICEVTVIAPSGESQTEQKFLTIGDQEVYLEYIGSTTWVKEQGKAERETLQLKVSNHEGETLKGVVQYQLRKDSPDQGVIAYRGELSCYEKHALPDSWLSLPSGKYYLSFSYTLPSGKVIESTPEEIVIFSLRDKKLTLGKDLWAFAPRLSFTDQKLPELYIASQSDKQPIFYLVSHEGGTEELKQLPLMGRNTLQRLHISLPSKPLAPEYEVQKINVLLYTVKDGVLLEKRISFQREEKAQNPTLTWHSFRDRVIAGSQEQWSVQLSYPNQKPFAHAQSMVWMYDSALDYIAPYTLPEYTLVQPLYFSTATVRSLLYTGNLYPQPMPIALESTRTGRSKSALRQKGRKDTSWAEIENAVESIDSDTFDENQAKKSVNAIRHNFAETAFFYPNLQTDTEGKLTWCATLPQSITRWRLCIFSYDPYLNYTNHDRYIEAYKKFSVEPMMPRFVRIGDETHIQGVIRNLTEESLETRVVFEVFEPSTDSVLYCTEQSLILNANRQEAFKFAYYPTSNYPIVGIRIVAQAGAFSDGEQHLLSQLPAGKNIQQAFPIVNKGERTHLYSLKELFPKNTEPQRAFLTVNVVSNAELLALLALPYLSMQSSVNSVDLLASIYSQSTLKRLLQKPAIKNWMKWKEMQLRYGKEAGRLSTTNLPQQQPLEETPWKSFAQAEEEHTRALLRWTETPSQTLLTLLSDLQKMQQDSGHWVWYKGMSESPYLTPIIIEMLGRITPNLTNTQEREVVQKMLSKAWKGYVQDLLKRYDTEIKKADSNKAMLYPAIEYLYLHHSFRATKKIEDSKEKDFYSYALTLLKKEAQDIPLSLLPSSAMALYHAGAHREAEKMARSLESHLSPNNEKGAFFAGLNNRYHWYSPSMRMQLITMELFNLIGGRESTINAMKHWIVNQKRTTLWDSPLASIWAIESLFSNEEKDKANYSLDTISITLPLRTGGTLLQKGEEVQITRPLESLDLSLPVKVEQSARDKQLWGGVHASFYQDFEEVAPHDLPSLSVNRLLFVRHQEAGEEKLIPITAETPLSVGDRIITQLHIKCDRDFDFIALIDTRIGGCEPVEQTSGYKWNKSIDYYREIRDSETRFYLQHISRGEHFLQYEQVVVRSGSYTPGIATLQSAYAPEYSAHTGGTPRITIQSTDK